MRDPRARDGARAARTGASPGRARRQGWAGPDGSARAARGEEASPGATRWDASQAAAPPPLRVGGRRLGRHGGRGEGSSAAGAAGKANRALTMWPETPPQPVRGGVAPTHLGGARLSGPVSPPRARRRARRPPGERAGRRPGAYMARGGRECHGNFRPPPRPVREPARLRPGEAQCAPAGGTFPARARARRRHRTAAAPVVPVRRSERASGGGRMPCPA